MPEFGRAELVMLPLTADIVEFSNRVESCVTPAAAFVPVIETVPEPVAAIDGLVAPDAAVIRTARCQLVVSV